MLAAIAITLGACSRSAKGPDAAVDAFRVALLTPGPVSDKSWNGGAYAGLMAIRDSLGAVVSHIQTKTPAEFDENFRQYGAQSFDLVFGHGFEFQDAALRVAPSYPKTVYVTTSGTSVARNVAGADFAFEEASYLAGLVAGRMTRTSVLGVIGGTELPPVKRSFAAFEEGARRVNPRIKVIVSYIGNWDDASAGKEQAIAQIARGVDVIFQNADAAGLGVFQAVKESGKVWIIGSNANQNDIAPERTLGSVVIDLPHAFLLIAREVQKPRFTGRVFSLGLHDDVVRYIPNPRTAKAVAPDVSALVATTAAQMKTGEFGERILPDSMQEKHAR
ncbi:MAG TPA: BMP family protein [Gemmatimonadaceae bacterium]|nr:BMP family protein [Gemmatimonadaceae bacterium]